MKNQGHENLKATIPSADYDKLKATRELGSMITNGGRNICEIISRIRLQKQHSTGRRLFTRNLTKKLV